MEKSDFQKIQQLIETESTFTFELRALRILKKAGFKCQHSEAYVDPVSKKVRQFDIRALKASAGGVRWHLAVECKMLADALLIHATERLEHESFHELLLAPSDDSGEIGPHLQLAVKKLGTKRAGVLSGQVYRLGRTYTPYYEDAWVGKSQDLIKNAKDGTVSIKSDAEVFEKITQALSSTGDIADRVFSEAPSNSVTAVIPILVIPDGKLLQVNYDHEGNIAHGPQEVNHAQLYVNKAFPINSIGPGGPRTYEFTVSHIDIITISHLQRVTDIYCGNSTGMKSKLVPI